MSYNRPHRITKDIQNCKINKSSKDNTNKNFVSRSVKNIFSSEQKYINDLDTSSSTLLTDLYTDLPNKHRNIHGSGSVDKRPLRRSQVRSSTCIEYGGGDYNNLMKPVFDRRTLNNRRESYIYEGDDIDYIPVKLASSDANFSSTYDKMKSSRNSITMLKSDNKKSNSWGKVLKEQNVVKDTKKLSGILQTSKPKNVPKPVLKQPTTTKEKRVVYDPAVPVVPPSNRFKLSTPNSVESSTSSKGVSSKGPRSKSRSRNLIENEPLYSDSATTITGESIMLVDRSAQCSSTTIEPSTSNFKRNTVDINQAGDTGLAYFNPVRTLNFLVRELRGKLSEGSEDENMARIIHDMENTIARLSTSTQHTKQSMDNWNTLISEDDLKYVLELLQSPPIPKSPVLEQVPQEKGASELQTKLEETCEKLESMCLQMEQVTCCKLREEKEILFSKLNERNKEFEELTNKVSQHEYFIKELKKRTEEQSKIIIALKDTNNRASALNKILNEQLEDTEKKYQELVTEMQFLMLEKEKNIVLMKCKDQDLMEMRKNLEEIKALVIEHLTSINVQSGDSATKLSTDNKLDFDNLTTVSAMSLSALKNSPNNTPTPNSFTEPARFDKGNTTPVKSSCSEKSVTSKTIGIKASIKNILKEMKQTHLRSDLSVQNLINMEDQTGISNWSDMDVSDEELQSPTGFPVSETDIHF